MVEAIKKALAMGCDRAVHIQDPAVHAKDPWQIASIIAAYAKEQGFDLIFTGMQSQDRGSAQVGVHGRRTARLCLRHHPGRLRL